MSVECIESISTNMRQKGKSVKGMKHEKAPAEDHIRNRIDHMHTHLYVVLLSSNVGLQNVSAIRISIN